MFEALHVCCVSMRGGFELGFEVGVEDLSWVLRWALHVCCVSMRGGFELGFELGVEDLSWVLLWRI